MSFILLPNCEYVLYLRGTTCISTHMLSILYRTQVALYLFSKQILYSTVQQCQLLMWCWTWEAHSLSCGKTAAPARIKYNRIDNKIVDKKECTKEICKALTKSSQMIYSHSVCSSEKPTYKCLKQFTALMCVFLPAFEKLHMNMYHLAYDVQYSNVIPSFSHRDFPSLNEAF